MPAPPINPRRDKDVVVALGALDQVVEARPRSRHREGAGGLPDQDEEEAECKREVRDGEARQPAQLPTPTIAPANPPHQTLHHRTCMRRIIPPAIRGKQKRIKLRVRGVESRGHVKLEVVE